MTVTVELFTSGGCPHCAKAVNVLKRVREFLSDEQLKLRQVDVVDEIDYAVVLGVLATPAVVIDGKLVFTSLPTEKRLREEIIRRTSF